MQEIEMAGAPFKLELTVALSQEEVYRVMVPLELTSPPHELIQIRHKRSLLVMRLLIATSQTLRRIERA
jgi:hypothetical protein